MLQGLRAKPNDEKFTELCNKTGGNASAIAVSLGVHRSTIIRWASDDAVFAQAIDDAREASLDIVEDRAMMLISGIPIKNENGEIVAWQERPDSGLIKFVLATRGKRRGYGESLALTDPKGEPLTINIIRRAKPESDTNK